MTDSAPFALGRRTTRLPNRPAVAAAGRGFFEDAVEVAQPAPAEQLWCEHGWGLSGGVVAGMVAVIVLLASAAQLLG